MNLSKNEKWSLTAVFAGLITAVVIVLIIDGMSICRPVQISRSVNDLPYPQEIVDTMVVHPYSITGYWDTDDEAIKIIEIHVNGKVREVVLDAASEQGAIGIIEELFKLGYYMEVVVDKDGNCFYIDSYNIDTGIFTWMPLKKLKEQGYEKYKSVF